MRVAIVKAAFDGEAAVWYVEHSDVEGCMSKATLSTPSARTWPPQSPIS